MEGNSRTPISSDPSHSGLPIRLSGREGRDHVALKAIFFAAAIILTAGCRTSFRQWVQNGFKVGPNYSPPQAKVSDRWIDASHPALNVQPAPIPQTSQKEVLNRVAWWNLFNDPTLTELIRRASTANLPLQIAAERVIEARALLGVARGTLWPQQQEMKGSYTRNKFSGEAFPWGRFPLRREFDDWSIGFQAAWELDFWGRYRRMIEAAEANVEAQEASYDEMLVILQAEVATNYIQLRSFDERLALARENLDLQQKTLEIVRARFQAGLVSGLDLHQAETIVAQTESLIPLLEVGRRRAENRLCTLLGIPPQDLDPLLGSGEIPQPPAEVVIGLPADLLRQRPDVRRAERLVAAQSARVGIAESDLYPHFAIAGTLNWQAEKFSHMFMGDALAGHVGPAFSWKILNYGRVWNNIWAEDSRLRQAILAYQETVLRAAEEAEGMIAAYLREKERVQAVEKAVEATERAVQLATALYQQGVIDYQRLIDSQRALLQQQDGLAESKGNVALYLVGLYKALGGGWQIRYLPPEASQPETFMVQTETKSRDSSLMEGKTKPSPEPAVLVASLSPGEPGTPAGNPDFPVPPVSVDTEVPIPLLKAEDSD